MVVVAVVVFDAPVLLSEFVALTAKEYRESGYSEDALYDRPAFVTVRFESATGPP